MIYYDRRDGYGTDSGIVANETAFSSRVQRASEVDQAFLANDTAAV
jgi:hypothetical protein